MTSKVINQKNSSTEENSYKKVGVGVVIPGEENETNDEYNVSSEQKIRTPETVSGHGRCIEGEEREKPHSFSQKVSQVQLQTIVIPNGVEPSAPVQPDTLNDHIGQDGEEIEEENEKVSHVKPHSFSQKVSQVQLHTIIIPNGVEPSAPVLPGTLSDPISQDEEKKDNLQNRKNLIQQLLNNELTTIPSSIPFAPVPPVDTISDHISQQEKHEVKQEEKPEVKQQEKPEVKQDVPTINVNHQSSKLENCIAYIKQKFQNLKNCFTKSLDSQKTAETVQSTTVTVKKSTYAEIVSRSQINTAPDNIIVLGTGSSIVSQKQKTGFFASLRHLFCCGSSSIENELPATPKIK